MRPALLRIPRPLGWLLILVGLSAFAGGVGLLTATDGSNMGWDVDMLDGSPFNDFLVPGLVLFLAVGGTSLAAGIAVLQGWKLAAEAAFAAGAIVFGWITIQVLIINEVNFLHWIYWTVGAVEMAAALALWRVRRTEGRARTAP